MTKEQLIQKKAALEQNFIIIKAKMDEANAAAKGYESELLRLQGEHRFIESALKEEESVPKEAEKDDTEEPKIINGG